MPFDTVRLACGGLSWLPIWSASGVSVVPIRIFLDGHSAFDPEHIQSMSKALADALTTLGLAGKSDDLTIIVAKKIIELAKAGERDPERLKTETLRSLRH